jgi:Phage Terminase
MSDALGKGSLRRWRVSPLSFIAEVLCDPETGKPFELNDAEIAFLSRAFELDANGRLKHPELVFAAIKKSGKTALAAMILLTMVLLFGGRFAEGICCANDLEQSTGRTFAAARRIVEASPLLAGSATMTASKIEFPEIHATITAIASDYSGAAGANPAITVFDELWAYTSERSRRLWDEMVPPPTRKIACRLTVTYAGFEGESELLEEIYKRGLRQPCVGDGLYAGDGLLMAWHHKPIAPWQTPEWVEQMRSQLRPNAFLRMIENRFVSTESSFVDIACWDACVDPVASPVLVDRSLPVFVGVDASVKHDSTAIVACAWDQAARRVRLVTHKVFQPRPDQPLDFEMAVENTVRDLSRRFYVQKVLYDPYQMQASAQRLLREGVRIEEFPQTPANLTAASQNLYELVQGRNLTLYADAGMRLAVNRAVAVETPRGWKITKEKQSHKIDVVVALAMACQAAISGQAYIPITWTGEMVERLRIISRQQAMVAQNSAGYFQLGERALAQMRAGRSRSY